MQIYQHELGDILKYLPDLKPFDQSYFEAKRCRLFICTLGFEDRTSRIVTELAQSGLLKEAILLLICYPTNEEENAVHLPDFEAAALMMQGIEKLDYSRSDFVHKM